MKFFMLTLCASAATAAADVSHDPDFPTFMMFMDKYNKAYSNQAEVEGRFQIFKQNLHTIALRNNDGGKDVHAVNQFTDLHPSEFKKMYLGTRIPTPTNCSNTTMFKTMPKSSVLKSASNIDWRLKGAVTPIKNQGQCGSCWAFSATEQIESDTFLATGTLPVLAPQQIVSCCTTADGCDGGYPTLAYSYVQSIGGQEYNIDYTYTSGYTQTKGTCDFSSQYIAPNSKPASFRFISQSASQETDMVNQIQDSPMSVCVDATIWQTYESGIISVNDACGTEIDHAVQAIGVGGADTDTPYWIVRNSWADTWGIDGCIYVEMGSDVCGIATYATVTSQP